MEKVLKTLIADFKLADMVRLLPKNSASYYKVSDVKTWLTSILCNGKEVRYDGCDYVNAIHRAENVYSAMFKVGILDRECNGLCCLSDKAKDIINGEEDTTMLIKLRNGETLFLDERSDNSVRIEYRNTAVEVF